jgi:hypothetical protein
MRPLHLTLPALLFLWLCKGLADIRLGGVQEGVVVHREGEGCNTAEGAVCSGGAGAIGLGQTAAGGCQDPWGPVTRLKMLSKGHEKLVGGL